MKSEEIRNRFLKFFESRGHAIIPSASLVPENDPSVLFTTAGMQPLVPYLLGQKHPSGTCLVGVQKCVRTGDIDEIGDNTHLTFFEMLGNWSLGDYFKGYAIKWSYEFLIDREVGLGLEPERLYVTVFEGNEDAPTDEESLRIWTEIFQKAGLDPLKRIFSMPAESNWWSPGDNGPCGPDSEMFYDITGGLVNGMTKEEFIKADENQQVVEVWNDVFMEYEKKDGKVIGKLTQKNVDTGAGLERLTMVMQKKSNVFETDLFEDLMNKLDEMSDVDNLKSKRIIADHVRSAVFMISDGVIPANTDRGYILRRIIRRSTRHLRFLRLEEGSLFTLVNIVINQYGGVYENIKDKKELILNEIQKEEEKFIKTLENGLKQIDKLFSKYNGNIKEFELDVSVLFDLYQTYGFPIEISIEEINRRRIESGGVVLGNLVEKHFINLFEKEMIKHQELSRTGAEQKFKGGLADSSVQTTMLHTATHLMLAGLRKYLGDGVHQAGSNITEERLRFDFTHPEKISREILDKVEEYVNEAIEKKCDVVVEQIPKEQAQKTGVEGSFWEKYPDIVDVYTVKCSDGTVYSREICGGPHVKNSEKIKGIFKIKKEKASSAGVRRIKAVLE